MKTALLFDFSVDKAKNTIHVQREFAASVDLVWSAWTEPELLDQWWAPKPYKTVTTHMNFAEGGYWLYYMLSPENEKHWCRADYYTIVNQKSFTGKDAFCNELGEISKEHPRSLWHVTFEGREESTVVNIEIQYESLTDLETIIQMGFKDGFTMALGNLDQYIEAKFKLRTELRRATQPRVATYLNFPGNTEEAFRFYQSVFKTEFLGNGIQRFGDLPADANQPPIAESVKKMVLHVELPILGNHVLMGTDAPKEMGFTVIPGNNMHICVEPESREETKRLFDTLSQGGNITQPLQDMFWGSYYGSFTDKFGINWMVNYQSI